MDVHAKGEDSASENDSGSEDVFRWGYGDQSFSTFDAADQHEQNCPCKGEDSASEESASEEDSDSEDVFRCEYCDQSFSTFDAADQHEQNCPCKGEDSAS